VRLSAHDPDASSLPERRAFFQAGALALSSMLLGNNPALAEGNPQTIVLTGGNSGVGFEAVKRLASAGHTIVLPCRTMEKSMNAIERLQSTSGNLIAAECDLASLKSVQNFARELPNLIGNKKIDVLALNAGISRSTSATDVARTSEGFELTGKNVSKHDELSFLSLF
jgi:NADP-dependent 3-hydroxy acid dehydrogenase YdfG